MPLNPDSQFALYEPAKAIGNRPLASLATVQMHKSVFLARTCLARGHRVEANLWAVADAIVLTDRPRTGSCSLGFGHRPAQKDGRD
jgi:hypothetical protein